jgi:hypothetical protein
MQNWKNLLGQRDQFPMDQQATRAGAYTQVRDALQGEIERLAPDQADAYRRARQDAALGFRLSDLTAGDVRREGRVRGASLTDYMAMGAGTGLAPAIAAAADAGAAGVGTTAALAAGAGLVANQAWRRREHGVLAGRNERQIERLRTNPERYGAWSRRLLAAAERGPQAFAAAMYVAQQNDAAVRAAMAEEEDVQSIRDAGAEDLAFRQEMEAVFSDNPPVDATDMTEAELEEFFR